MSSSKMTRRRALALGGGVAAGGLLAQPPLGGVARASSLAVHRQHGRLPAGQMQRILQAQGMVSDGVLSIDVSRSDIGVVRGPQGVTFSGSFENDGTLTFEPLGDDLAFFNGDLPVLAHEANPFIAAILANGLTFQAFHQHLIELDPQVWFIHWRGLGDPLKLAAAVRNSIRATATPFPQMMPKHPTSPLDAKRLGEILHGDAQIGDDGVVTVDVDRRDTIIIGDVHASPDSNINTDIEFKPRSSHGSVADVVPDFALTGPEVTPVVETMRKQGWMINCLYNQETEEHPQLYFSHMLKTGDAYDLAREIRAGLDMTNSQ